MTIIQMKMRIKRARNLLKPCISSKNLDLLNADERALLINIHVKLNALYIAQAKRSTDE